MKKIFTELFLKIKKDVSRSDFYIVSPDYTYKKASRYTFPFLHVVCDNFFSEKEFVQLSQMLDQEDKTLVHKSLYNSKSPLHYFLSENLFLTAKRISKRFDLSTDVMCTVDRNFPKTEHRGIHKGWYKSSFMLEGHDKDRSFLKNSFIQNHKEELVKEGKIVLKEGEYLRRRCLVSVFYYKTNQDSKESDLTFYSKDSHKEVFYTAASFESKSNRIIFFEVNPKTFHEYKKCMNDEKDRKCIINWFYV